MCRSTTIRSEVNPGGASLDVIHICATRGQRLPLAAFQRPMHGQQEGSETPPCWRWLGKAAMQGSNGACRMFVHTALPLLPSRAYTERCSPLLECNRKKACATSSVSVR